MERTRMRVALLCCWLDCDSSLAGASLVILVCSDGSDLQDQQRAVIKKQFLFRLIGNLIRQFWQLSSCIISS